MIIHSKRSYFSYSIRLDIGIVSHTMYHSLIIYTSYSSTCVHQGLTDVGIVILKLSARILTRIRHLETARQRTLEGTGPDNLRFQMKEYRNCRNPLTNFFGLGRRVYPRFCQVPIRTTTWMVWYRWVYDIVQQTDSRGNISFLTGLQCKVLSSVNLSRASRVIHEC